MKRANGWGRREVLLAGLAGAPAAKAAGGPGCGPSLGAERWAVIEPVWAGRQGQLERLRGFRVAEGVEPGGE